MFATSKTLQLLLLSQALLPAYCGGSASVDDKFLRRGLQDTQAPTISCEQGKVFSVDSNGDLTITANQLATASDDMGTPTLTSNPDLTTATYDCSDVGPPFSVVVTATDGASNSAMCTATFLIEDQSGPSANCISGVTVEIDNSILGGPGTTAVNVTELAAPTDNCQIATVVANPTTVDCSNIGTPATIGVTVSDWVGIGSGCSAQVTVVDNTDPVMTCSNATVTLADNSGVSEGTIAASSLATITDNCPGSSVEATSFLFGCVSIGSNMIEVDGMDAHGQTTSCFSFVEVVDGIDPAALCLATYEVELMASSTNITTADVDNDSSDDCGIADQTLSQEMFTCADIAASPITVTMTVTDESGNQDTCDVDVTVVDVSQPILTCDEDVEVSLGSDGNAVIDAETILRTVNDNCDAVAGFPIITDDGATLSCADIGTPYLLTVTVEDVSGNKNSCQESVVVVDDAGPTPTCPAQVVDLSGASGLANLDMTTTSAVDNCGGAIATAFPSAAIEYSCNDIGTDTVTITFTDAMGNTATCDMAVTITDSTGFCAPSTSPSATPSLSPSSSPSAAPSNAPSSAPSGAPSSAPSVFPSSLPTPAPTEASFISGFFNSIMDLIDFLMDLLFGGFLGSIPDSSVIDGSIPDSSVIDGSIPDSSVVDGSIP